ncbi:hypothetical protein PBRA_003670 [Plasmodiophora brassicae]|uniref:ABC transporter domain-containing protein n=1 Tax=Plasmodiophora brassicae TaxID=37360 RepID=A0A0G4IIF0_PLABS|nr:hypothetical protein PBRA_003670 [Plasmodiophora brassicae]
MAVSPAPTEDRWQQSATAPSFFTHVRVLVYKNALLKMRNPWALLLELLLPFACLGLLVWIRTKVPSTAIPASIDTKSLPIAANGTAPAFLRNIASGQILVIAPPQGALSEALLANFQTALQPLGKAASVVTMADNAAIESYIDDAGYAKTKPQIVAAIIVNSPAFQYTIRMNATGRGFGGGAVPITQGNIEPFYIQNVDTQFQTYYAGGFIFLQTVIDQTIWALSNAHMTTYPAFVAQEFPELPISTDNFARLAGFLLPLLVVFGYTYTVTRVSKCLMEEKEARIAEGLKVIGVSDLALLLSHFIVYMVVFALQAGLITLISKPYSNRFSDPFLVWLLYFEFGACGIFPIAFFMTPFFTRQRVASMFTAVLFIVMTFVSFATTDMGRSGLLGVSLLPPVAFSQGVSLLAQADSGSLGITFSNLDTQFNGISLGDMLGFLALDFIIFTLIAVYLGKVLPSTYGVALPWNFFLKKSYWIRPPVETAATTSKDYPKKVDGDGRDVFEAPKSTAPVTVSIRKLRRTFNKGGTVAVSDLDLDLHLGEIFGLLGHNGAGKTTTISMLSGFIAPESGTATVFGSSLSHDVAGVRRSLGYCPQHDTLYAQLTVQEHLEMFGLLKGVPRGSIQEAVKQVVETIGLTEKVKTPSANLSGGQKRKLSIGMALIGDSKLILLDEPTSGMDPYSRRSTWEMIKRARQGRTILLTTHFMDEADQLSDRIGIMAHGELQCLGTSLFLKRLFGVGYTLTLSKSGQMGSGTDTAAVSDIVRTHVPGSELLSDVAAEMAFRLPLSHASKFPGMFDDIDSKRGVLGIGSYGVSVTTLSEVFLRVGNDVALNRQSARNLVREMSRKSQRRLAGADTPGMRPEVKNLFFRHIKAMLWKRFYSAKRDRKVLLWQIIIPIVLLVLGLFLVDLGIRTKFPAVLLTEDSQFGSSTVFPYGATNNAGTFKSVLDSVKPPPTMMYLPSATSKADVMNELLANYPNGQPRYGAAFVSSQGLTLLFNTSGYHSLPAHISMLSNAVLQMASPTSSIQLTAQALPLTPAQKSRSSALLALILGLAFAFIPASFAAFVIRERETQVLQQQLVSGVSTTAYWISTWIWDFISVMVPSVVCIALLYAFQVTQLTDDGTMGPAVLILVLFALAICPFTYIISYFFKDSNSGQTVILFVYIITVSGLLIAHGIMSVPQLGVTDVDNVLIWIYYLFPTFSMAQGLSNLMSRSSTLTLSNKVPGIWDMDVSGKVLIYLCSEIVGYFAILLLIEYVRRTPRLLAIISRDRFLDVRPVDGTPDEIDVDVAAEKQRVQSGGADKDVIVLRGLRKVYPSPTGVKVAVKDQWFGIPSGECFGFLGVNGAGKTTTIQMLTGDVVPTSGTAHLLGLEITQEQRRARQLIGYCPQFDALIHLMTAREHLHMYADIKGVPVADVGPMVDELIEQLGLQMYADLPCGGYSGGNRRKLSVGLALIGSPPLVFLDEPSTGMDPKSRRSLWDLICQTMSGKSVILTTHSMEECEALCTRVGIQVSGRLSCLGTPQHLKDRFGDAYQVELNVVEGRLDEAPAFMKLSFPDSALVEEQGSNLKYRVPKGRSLGDMFRIIETGATTLFDSYSVSDVTLEQIFIQFASKQTEELGHVRGLVDHVTVNVRPDAPQA